MVAITRRDNQLTALPAAQPDASFPFLDLTAPPHRFTIVLRPVSAFVLGKAKALRRLAGVALHPPAFSHAVVKVIHISTPPHFTTVLLCPFALPIKMVAIARGDLTAPPNAIPSAMFPFAHTAPPHRSAIPLRPRRVFVLGKALADRFKPGGQTLGG